jgi:cellulose synthase/poly-beta-1,6-N-acetylglucosamine synthase-like glycosyltransferase
MALTPIRNISQILNTNTDSHHWSYKVLGIIPWLTFLFCFVGIIIAPRLVLDFARIMAFYMMLRFVFTVLFYLVGLVRIRQTEQRVRQRMQSLPAAAGSPGGVHHMVVIPNYAEPLEVLSKTLHNLQAQGSECRRMTVVLGMEEREPEAYTKADQLIAHFEGKFANILATYHPDDLPGEVVGKGANEAWAVRQARQVLVNQMGIPAEQIIVTVADADSIIHSLYFNELSYLFETRKDRHLLVYNAPQLLDNQIWRTNASIRMLTYLTNAVQLSELADPGNLGTPISTYSLSLRLLESVNYWDPGAVTEDLNIFLRTFFGSGGKVHLQPIFLPTRSNPVLAANLWQSWVIYYRQKKRHAWGGTEIGYMLQKWNIQPPSPFYKKVARLTKFLLDHLLFSTAGVVILIGTVLSLVLDGNPVITIPPNSNPVVVGLINVLSLVGLGTFFIGERLRLAKHRQNWKPSILVAELISFASFSFLTLGLAALPALEAQTMMLFGETLTFQRTPKKFDSRAGQ